MVEKIYPCWHCGAPDARGADHQRGCPKLPPLSEERVRAIAEACVRGWQYAEVERTERQALRVQWRERQGDTRPGPRPASEARL